MDNRYQKIFNQFKCDYFDRVCDLITKNYKPEKQNGVFKIFFDNIKQQSDSLIYDIKSDYSLSDSDRYVQYIQQCKSLFEDGIDDLKKCATKSFVELLDSQDEDTKSQLVEKYDGVQISLKSKQSEEFNNQKYCFNIFCSCRNLCALAKIQSDIETKISKNIENILSYTPIEFPIRPYSFSWSIKQNGKTVIVNDSFIPSKCNDFPKLSKLNNLEMQTYYLMQILQKLR